jgi:nucleotide-binding universal stress UspA family protein
MTMQKILIAADDTKGSAAILSVFKNQVRPPEEVILVHVQRLLGSSLMGQMLGEAEMSTLKESVEGTEFKEHLDVKAEKIIAHFQKELENGGLYNIKTIIRMGNPTEEILKVAEEEQVDLMILGCNGKSRMDKLVSGCVTKDVERRTNVPVMVAKVGNCVASDKVCQTLPSMAKEYAMGGSK